MSRLITNSIRSTSASADSITFDSSGRLLVGTTTEGESAADELTISNSGNMGLTLRSTDSNYCNIYFSDSTSGTGEYSGYVSYLHSSDSLHIATSSTERMRISSVGRILINNTTEDFARVCLSVNASTEQPFSINDSNNTSTLTSRIGFRTGNTQVGIIKSSNSATQYNTSSDYRLKENVTAISDGITRLKTLKPSRFNFKVDKDTTVDGFIAHEVTAVPEAITGTKDEVDSDKNPVYQGIDQSKLVPLLTAALQEAVAKIEVLETKVAALEAG